MSKFTREEKLKMIEEYHRQSKSLTAISDKYGIGKSYLRQILRQYEKEGTDNIGLGKKGMTYGKYPGQYKLDIVKERIESGVGYNEIARKYNLNHVVVMKWERRYLEDGEQGLLEERRGLQVKEGNPSKGGAKRRNKKVEEDLIAEVQRLRMENEYLKKLNALIQDGKKSQPPSKRK